MNSFKAIFAYFGLVFGAGFILGPIRLLLLVPRVGTRTAELMESPVMLLAIIGAARWVARRWLRTAGVWRQLGVGIATVALIECGDILVGTLFRGMTITEVFTARDPVSGPVYYALLAVCAVMPCIVIRGVDGPDHPRGKRRFSSRPLRDEQLPKS